ncbi:hypothetical protein KY290_020792 [Solanum tuberosum]|uniref:Uncharacterized protein n=1 Tax=Solanum tuberosum TaxID=4113 RepID=A0ABQ7V1B0_SOLTU|nr:hypothetical protein KY290_020792 [Solanum tuberosum]
MIEVKFDLKPSKDENEVASRVKATTKYAYVAPGAVGKGRGRGLKSMLSLGVSRTDIPFSPSTDHVMQYNQFTETSFSQGWRTIDKTTLAHEKESLHSDIPISPIDQVKQSAQTTETSSCATGMDKKVRGIGKNSNLFSRHLGKIVRDRNICPLRVSSWKHIKEEKLNHMWAVVRDKFDSDDMNSHRDHVLGWIKKLWNKWRGQLHEKYVKGKPIQEALKNMPKGVENKQWEWLARSNRNAINRAKLKMLHRIGSKPIREIIYQKDGNYGNPPDLTSIFYKTRKKNNTLVYSETIEKHVRLAQIQELVESEPSLSSIEIVEKCFGPQSCSHVFGFGGGVKARDLKGGTSSKAELLAELRSTQKENQSFKDCMSNFQNEMKELKQLKDFF